MACVLCTTGTNDLAHLQKCDQECMNCAESCLPILQSCAADIDCENSVTAKSCSRNCATCMECGLSNDDKCAQCGCCTKCLPWSVKCANMADKLLSHGKNVPEDEFAFLAVYNHQEYFGGRGRSASADIDIRVVEDASTVMGRSWEPQSSRTANSRGTRGRKNGPDWLGQLYNPFQNLHQLEAHMQSAPTAGRGASSGDEYPVPATYSNKFVYEATAHLDKRATSFPSSTSTTSEVRVYTERVTLIRVDMDTESQRHYFDTTSRGRLELLDETKKPGIEVGFDDDAAKQLVLLFSSAPAPKTLFDFTFATGSPATFFRKRDMVNAADESRFFDGAAGEKPTSPHMHTTEDLLQRQPIAIPVNTALFSSATTTLGNKERSSSDTRNEMQPPATPHIWCAIFSQRTGVVRLRYRVIDYVPPAGLFAPSMSVVGLFGRMSWWTFFRDLVVATFFLLGTIAIFFLLQMSETSINVGQLSATGAVGNRAVAEFSAYGSAALSIYRDVRDYRGGSSSSSGRGPRREDAKNGDRSLEEVELQTTPTDVRTRRSHVDDDHGGTGNGGSGLENNEEHHFAAPLEGVSPSTYAPRTASFTNDPIAATRALLSVGPDAGFSNYEYYAAEEQVNSAFIRGTAAERLLDSLSGLWTQFAEKTTTAFTGGEEQDDEVLNSFQEQEHINVEGQHDIHFRGGPTSRSRLRDPRDNSRSTIDVLGVDDEHEDDFILARTESVVTRERVESALHAGAVEEDEDGEIVEIALDDSSTSPGTTRSARDLKATTITSVDLLDEDDAETTKVEQAPEVPPVTSADLLGNKNVQHADEKGADKGDLLGSSSTTGNYNLLDCADSETTVSHSYVVIPGQQDTSAASTTSSLSALPLEQANSQEKTDRGLSASSSEDLLKIDDDVDVKVLTSSSSAGGSSSETLGGLDLDDGGI
ncbi:unnamed protein product [Amoebophrya sp. A25]|nr:unnamed protein product [Amoebophrya sp. A25]|eukprot:GSA25T00011180001.1